MYCCVLAFLAFFVCSCGNEIETADKSAFKYAYFPLNIGSTYVYDSDSILIGNGGLYRDTFQSQIREIVKDSFRSADNQLLYSIDRHFRRNSNDDWSPINRWVASTNANFAFRTEENLKFIKLIFPTELNTRWDANKFFDVNQKIVVGSELMAIYPSWKSKIEAIDGKFTIQNAEYPTIQVNLVDFNSTIQFRRGNEWYADGIGLVRREIAVYDGDNTRPGDPWEVKAKKGLVHKLVLREFTK